MSLEIPHGCFCYSVYKYSDGCLRRQTRVRVASSKKKDGFRIWDVCLWTKINRPSVTGLDGEVMKSVLVSHFAWKSRTKALALVKDTLQAPFESFCAVASAYEDVWGQPVHSDRRRRKYPSCNVSVNFKKIISYLVLVHLCLWMGLFFWTLWD